MNGERTASDSAPARDKTEAKLAYFPYIEGMRGLGAFYVLTAHMYDHLFKLPGAPYPTLRGAAGFFKYGTFSIAVFIVISGYCLGAPLVRRLERPFVPAAFFRRRAARLLPAYYVALAGAVVVYAAERALRGGHESVRHLAAAAGLHALLLHNLFPQFMYTIDAPMWTIALEVQIYVVFALLLVPVWKRYGSIAQLAVALAVGLLPHVLSGGRLDYTAAWFVALFGMGVTAADFTGRMARSRLWPAAAVVLLGTGVVAMARTGDPGWQVGLVIGAGVALFMGSCAAGHFRGVVRVLSLRPIVALGAFSYSLYLVHGPVVGLAGALLTFAHAPGPVWLAAYALVVPISLAVAYGLYRLAERPAMSPALRSGIERSVHRPVTTPVMEVALP